MVTDGDGDGEGEGDGNGDCLKPFSSYPLRFSTSLKKNMYCHGGKGDTEGK